MKCWLNGLRIFPLSDIQGFSMPSLKARALVIALLCALPLTMAHAKDKKDRTVTINNKTNMTMTEFYASRTNLNDWEEDFLGEDALDSGESVDVEVDDGSSACVYDFKAVFKGGATAMKEGINVCEISEFDFNN
jgi:hypothetical protein